MPPFSRLRDAHVHIYDFGDSLTCVDLFTCRSRDELLERIAKAQPDHTGWIRGMNAAPQRWPDPTWPSAGQLHEAARGHPCFARSLDIHSMCASSEALNRAGINSDAADPDRGVIVRDERGEPTGLLLELACNLVLDAVPQPSSNHRKETIRTALDRFASFGFVEVHDMLSAAWLGPICAELEREGALPCRVVLHPLFEDIKAELDRADSYRSEMISIGGAKIFTDGALNSRTAFMLEPFADPLPGLERGMVLWEPERLRDVVRTCDEMRIPLVAHAIGDAAVRRLFDAIEAEAPTTPGFRGFRIEHAQFVDESDIPRFARAGVIVSPQPCHLLTDIEAITRLLPHRAHRAFPLRDLYDAYADAGLDPVEHIWLGSDAPVVQPDPRDNIQAAVHRTRPSGDAPTIAPEQALSEEEAMSLMQAPSRAVV